MFIDQTAILEFSNGTDTYSYPDVPVMEGLGGLPVLVFSSGGLGTVSSNVALMEEFASHGYAAFSVTHPGGSSGIQYPNGDAVRYDDLFLYQVLASLTPDPEGLSSTNITTRYLTRQSRLKEKAFLSQFASRWRDDMIALVDFLQVSNDTILRAVRGADEGPPSSLVFGGHSFGGAAAGSAAHLDTRASAAFNLDGTHDMLDVFGKSIRVPYLTLSSQDVSLYGYSNEFFFEPLPSMGLAKDGIHRIAVPGIAHVEFTDVAFSPVEARYPVGGGILEDGLALHKLILDFTFGFVEKHSGRSTEWSLTKVMEKHAESVGEIDVSYVREWAAEFFEVPSSLEDTVAPTNFRGTTIAPTVSPPNPLVTTLEPTVSSSSISLLRSSGIDLISVFFIASTASLLLAEAW